MVSNFPTLIPQNALLAWDKAYTGVANKATEVLLLTVLSPCQSLLQLEGVVAAEAMSEALS